MVINNLATGEHNYSLPIEETSVDGSLIVTDLLKAFLPTGIARVTLGHSVSKGNISRTMQRVSVPYVDADGVQHEVTAHVVIAAETGAFTKGENPATDDHKVASNAVGALMVATRLLRILMAPCRDGEAPACLDGTIPGIDGSCMSEDIYGQQENPFVRAQQGLKQFASSRAYIGGLHGYWNPKTWVAHT